MLKKKILVPRLFSNVIFLGGWLGLLMGSPPAQAVGDNDGWYIAGGWGFYRIDNEKDLDAAFTDLGFTTSTTVKKSNSVFRLFAGYQFTKWLAMEVGYMNFTKLTFGGTQTAPTGATYSGTFEPEGFLVDIYLGFPIHQGIDKRVSLFLKGGAFRWDADRRVTASGGTLGQLASGRDHDVDAHGGVGVHIRGRRHAAVRVMFERFKDIRDVDLNVLALDVMYYY